jgi:hypothetical protein
VIEYFLFALLYLWQPNHCIPHIKHLRIALWFSVQTAATIGAQAACAGQPGGFVFIPPGRLAAANVQGCRAGKHVQQ